MLWQWNWYVHRRGYLQFDTQFGTKCAELTMVGTRMKFSAFLKTCKLKRYMQYDFTVCKKVQSCNPNSPLQCMPCIIRSWYWKSKCWEVWHHTSTLDLFFFVLLVLFLIYWVSSGISSNLPFLFSILSRQAIWVDHIVISILSYKVGPMVHLPKSDLWYWDGQGWWVLLWCVIFWSKFVSCPRFLVCISSTGHLSSEIYKPS